MNSDIKTKETIPISQGCLDLFNRVIKNRKYEINLEEYLHRLDQSEAFLCTVLEQMEMA